MPGIPLRKFPFSFHLPKADIKTQFRRFLRRMALRKKIQKLLCASAHGDIATYFFFEKIFRSDGEMCVSVASFLVLFVFETLK